MNLFLHRLADLTQPRGSEDLELQRELAGWARALTCPDCHEASD